MKKMIILMAGLILLFAGCSNGSSDSSGSSGGSNNSGSVNGLFPESECTTNSALNLQDGNWEYLEILNSLSGPYIINIKFSITSDDYDTMQYTYFSVNGTQMTASELVTEQNKVTTVENRIRRNSTLSYKKNTDATKYFGQGQNAPGNEPYTVKVYFKYLGD